MVAEKGAGGKGFEDPLCYPAICKDHALSNRLMHFQWLQLCVYVCMCACVHGVQVRYTTPQKIYWSQTYWYGVLEPDLLVWSIGTRLAGMEYWSLTCLGMRSSISVLSLSLSCTLTSTPSNSSAPSREGGGGCRSAKHSEQSHGIPHLLVVFSLSAFEQYPQENK